MSLQSWAQLTMQLAYYKMTGKFTGTYESAQTRKFKHGRTEVIRSTTTESAQWCKAMESHGVSVSCCLRSMPPQLVSYRRCAPGRRETQAVPPSRRCTHPVRTSSGGRQRHRSSFLWCVSSKILSQGISLIGMYRAQETA